MSHISTHILYTVRGIPAVDVGVTLIFVDNGSRTIAGGGRTDENGRITDLCSKGKVIGYASEPSRCHVT
jgi:5-hydroxyisourate hydrolase-like protein (transthyretin family)